MYKEQGWDPPDWPGPLQGPRGDPSGSAFGEEFLHALSHAGTEPILYACSISVKACQGKYHDTELLVVPEPPFWEIMEKTL